MRTWALLLVLAGGCSGAASHGDAGAPDLGAAPDLAGCTDSPSERPDGGLCLLSVGGRVVDEAGAPIVNRLISVCGDLCFYGRTVADGSFTVPVKAHLLPADYAIELHGREDRAGYYLPLPPFDGELVSVPGSLPLPLLPASGPALLLDGSAQTVTSGEVSLVFAAGTMITLDPSDQEMMPVGSQLRVLKVAQPGTLPFVDAAHPPDALYAVAPFEASFSAKVGLRIVNSAGLPAGAAVDVLTQRSLANAPPPAGALERVAGAHVSADGSTITTDPGEGVTLLDWIALRKQ